MKENKTIAELAERVAAVLKDVDYWTAYSALQIAKHMVAYRERDLLIDAVASASAV